VKEIRAEIENKIASSCKRNPKTLNAYVNSQKKCRDDIQVLKLEDG